MSTSTSIIIKPFGATLSQGTDHLIFKKDPYVCCQIGNEVQQTKVHENGGANPRWNDVFSFGQLGPKLRVTLCDDDKIQGKVVIGEGEVDLTPAYQNPNIAGNREVQILKNGVIVARVNLQIEYRGQPRTQINPNPNPNPNTNTNSYSNNTGSGYNTNTNTYINPNPNPNTTTTTTNPVTNNIINAATNQFSYNNISSTIGGGIAGYTGYNQNTGVSPNTNPNTYTNPNPNTNPNTIPNPNPNPNINTNQYSLFEKGINNLSALNNNSSSNQGGYPNYNNNANIGAGNTLGYGTAGNYGGNIGGYTQGTTGGYTQGTAGGLSGNTLGYGTTNTMYTTTTYTTPTTTLSGNTGYNTTIPSHPYTGNTLGYGTTIPTQTYVTPSQPYTTPILGSPTGTVTYTTATGSNLSNLGYSNTTGVSSIHPTSSTVVSFGAQGTTTTTTVIRK